jgi:hypothetical protein
LIASRCLRPKAPAPASATLRVDAISNDSFEPVASLGLVLRSGAEGGASRRTF